MSGGEPIQTEAAWLAANQRWIAAAIDGVRARLARHAVHRTDDPAARAAADDDEVAARQAEDDARRELLSPPALESLCEVFGLSAFERAVILTAAATELDASFAAVVGTAHGDARRTRLTFGLALAALPGPHWSALTPQRPLRALRLVELAPDAGLTQGELRIDERILHHLCGIDSIDERLRGVITPLGPTTVTLPSYQAMARRVAATWSVDTLPPIVQLCGDHRDAGLIAATAADLLGARLHLLRAIDAPIGSLQRELAATLWAREVVLRGGALLIECHDGDPEEALRAAGAFAEGAGRMVAIASREPLRNLRRVSVAVAIERPTRGEQRAIWKAVLGERATTMNGALDRVVGQFRLGITSLQAAGHQVRALATDAPLDRAMWDACREQARPRLEGLAAHVETGATWDDLVLPAAERRTLAEIASQVRQRVKVYEDWGFGRGGRGLGISVLFAGASGTGKTLAAEVLAHDLGIDLFRIDLSQVVSKYIGETEKNLRRIFDAADDGSAVLLFDEADALFGKRTEVKDSHDRYANIEVSYLLQRMETYGGVAILTSNMKESLDAAFLRRIRFVVQFPFPAASERREIWRRAFPAGVPREGIDLALLARLNIAGGNIRSIAVNAAFLAAEEGSSMQMRHVLHAVETEYAKLERPLTEIDPRGVS
jgi:hypothetical protein